MADQINQTAMPVQVQKIIYNLANWHWQEKLALALMLFSVLMWIFVDRPTSARLATLVVDVQLQKQRLLSKPYQMKLPSMRSESEQFTSILPAENQANRCIAELLQLATQQGIPIDKVEYSTQTNAKSKLQTVHIQLPIKDNYVQIRQFINQALITQPSLALSEIRFSRDDLRTEQVEANMAFTLYLQQK